MTLTADDGGPVVIPANGRKSRITWTNGSETEIEAGWKDGALRIQRKGQDRAKVAETYSRGPGSPRLIVEATVEGGPRGEMKIRRIYDLADPEE